MKHLPGILFLIAMPLSVFLFVKVDEFFHSEILALLSAVALYVLVAFVIGFVFNRRASKSDGQYQSGSRKTQNFNK